MNDLSYKMGIHCSYTIHRSKSVVGAYVLLSSFKNKFSVNLRICGGRKQSLLHQMSCRGKAPRQVLKVGVSEINVPKDT